MSQEKSEAYKDGWNAFIDGKGSFDNPWTMTSTAGHDWEEGNNDAFNQLDREGGLERL